MFCKTTPQSSLLELHVLYPGLLPANDWSFIYREHIYPLINEEDFRHLFSETGGAPNKPIKVMVSLLIFMGLEKLTWRETENQFLRRIDWHVATCAIPGEVTVDFTTLFKFYQRLEQDEAAMNLFHKLANQFADLCGTSLRKQRTDTFFIHGWLKLLSRYDLFRETCRVFLQNLRKQKPGLYDQIKGELSRDYLKEGYDAPEKDKELAQRQIQQMARDLYRLKTAFENHKQAQHYESFKTLVTVFSQQCAVAEKATTSEKSKASVESTPGAEKSPKSDHVKNAKTSAESAGGAGSKKSGKSTEKAAPVRETKASVESAGSEASTTTNISSETKDAIESTAGEASTKPCVTAEASTKPCVTAEASTKPCVADEMGAAVESSNAEGSTKLSASGDLPENSDPQTPEITGSEKGDLQESPAPQSLEITGSEKEPDVIIREQPVGDEIISSPHNTDARYIRKGQQRVTGHKGLVSETCDADALTQFLTDVTVTPVTQTDAAILPDSHERREEAGLKPELEVADAAFINGPNILAAHDRGIELHGPTAGRSQSQRAFETPDRPLDAADFDIELNLDTRQITVKACPAGHAPLDQVHSDKAGHELAHFDPQTCAGCPLKDRCPVKIQKHTATLTVSAADVAGARQHRRFMTDPAYRKVYRPRAGIEGTVSELTRGHGVRKSRHKNGERTLLQMIFAGIACNVKRFIRHGQNHGFERPQPAPKGA